MKLLIVGSRTIKNFDLNGHVPAETDLIISGGAKGGDTLAEKYADEHGIDKLIIAPDYSNFGHYAPLKRNKEMVDLADAVLAIWDGRSRGTMHTIDYARSIGKTVLTVLYESK